MNPTASLFISTYNQELFIRDAILSCASQQNNNVELVISDDKSTDSTKEVIYNTLSSIDDPREIKVNLNAENQGLINHINLAPKLCRGELIINCAGDDISLPDRAEKIIAAYERSGRSALLIHSKAIEMSPEGVDEKTCGAPMIERHFTLEDLGRRFTAYQGCTGAWNRKLFDIFGPISYTSTYEDVVIAFRAALLDAIVYIDEPLVRYRVRVGISFTKDNERTQASLLRARDRKQLVMAIDTLKQRLQDMSCIPENERLLHLRKLISQDLLYYEARKVWQDEGLAGILKQPINRLAALSIIVADSLSVLKLHLQALMNATR